MKSRKSDYLLYDLHLLLAGETSMGEIGDDDVFQLTGSHVTSPVVTFHSISTLVQNEVLAASVKTVIIDARRLKLERILGKG